MDAAPNDKSYLARAAMEATARDLPSHAHSTEVALEPITARMASARMASLHPSSALLAG